MELETRSADQMVKKVVENLARLGALKSGFSTSKGNLIMKHASRILNIALSVGLLSLVIVTSVSAQGTGTTDDTITTLFAPFLATALSIERLLQLIRNLVSPDPEKGPLARDTKTLKYFMTIGGVLLGEIFTFLGEYHLLADAGLKMSPLLDTVITGITVGLGSEFIHQVIAVIGAAKSALRKTAEEDNG